MTTPTLYEWVGGLDTLRELTSEFYRRVLKDPLLEPVFRDMDDGHPEHVALFLAEVLGGPQLYTEKHGGHPEMIRHHLRRNLSEEKRRRWMALLQDTYSDMDAPQDPEFMSSLVGYLEWGSRLAVINSKPDAEVFEDAPMPKWGWGETGGPWQGA